MDDQKRDSIKKVYCENCKYKKTVFSFYNSDFEYKCKKNPVESSIHKIDSYEDCEYINTYNNCVDFKPTLFYRIKMCLSGKKNEW